MTAATPTPERKHRAPSAPRPRNRRPIPPSVEIPDTEVSLKFNDTPVGEPPAPKVSAKFADTHPEVSTNFVDTPQAKPAPVPYARHIVDAHEIPAELRGLKCWVAWRLVQKSGKAKPDKEPISPVTGGTRGWTDPAHHGTFEQARDYAEAHHLHGLGIVLTPGCGLAGGDLDHCRDPATGELTGLAKGIIAEVDTYTEVSPGMSGLRFFVFGSFGGHTGRNGEHDLEFYEQGRFLTITGNHLEDTPFAIERRDLTDLGRRYFGQAKAPAGATAPPPEFRKIDLATITLSDHARHVIATGDCARYGNDRSKALHAMAKDLVKAGLDDGAIASVLCDPANGIRDKARSERGDNLISMLDWTATYTVRKARAEVEGEQTHDPGPDWNAAPPKPTKAMFYGLVGDIAREGAKGREVSKVSVALAFLSYLSAQTGRDLYIPIGDYRHPLHLFTLHVGRTAMGGKGESVQITRRIDQEIRNRVLTWNQDQNEKDGVLVDLKDDGKSDNDEEKVRLLAFRHTGGLSTREGLTHFIHDQYSVGKDVIPAIEDKRLWVFEPEFQNVLAQGKRDGNTLSSALRDVWDGGSIKPATKSFRIWATEPHIGLHGCITPGELHASLEAKEITNGFANRFLVCWAERTRLVPVPPPTPEETVSRLAERVREVVSWAVGNYPLDKYTRPMLLTPAAEALWIETYGTLKGRDHTSERITAILERRAPITRRLAALFAITDRTTLVDVHHLEAALAWSEYHRSSVEFIFGADAQEREQASKTSEIRHKIAAYLTGKDWVLRSEIYAKALAKRVSARDFDLALQAMLADRQIQKVSQERNGNAPNTKTLYRLVTR